MEIIPLGFMRTPLLPRYKGSPFVPYPQEPGMGYTTKAMIV